MPVLGFAAELIVLQHLVALARHRMLLPVLFLDYFMCEEQDRWELFTASDSAPSSARVNCRCVEGVPTGSARAPWRKRCARVLDSWPNNAARWYCRINVGVLDMTRAERRLVTVLSTGLLPQGRSTHRSITWTIAGRSSRRMHAGCPLCVLCSDAC